MKNPPRPNLSLNSFNLSLIIVFVLVLGISHAWTTTGAAGSSGSGMHAQAVEETVTLAASDVKTWRHGYQWYPDLPYCGPPFHIFPALEEDAGSMFAGYEHYYDKGKPVFGCPDGAQVVFRGTAWFDLASISSKAPPLHVFATSALLHFKKDKSCPGEEILIANADWLKGFSGGDLVPGDPFKELPTSGSEDTVMDVTSVVNNWLRGEDHGGYANYGFVFKGPLEADLKYSNNDACVVRYSDLSLTVKYKYDKAAPINVRRPDSPITVNPGLLDIRKNVALASNGATATAQDYTQDSVYPGSHFQPSYAIDGKRYVHLAPPPNDADGFWRDEHGLSSWLQIDFSGSKTINEVDIFTLRDAPKYLEQVDPPFDEHFFNFGVTAFEVQYWTGSAWAPLPGILPITKNNLVWTKLDFSKVTTSKIRVVVNAAPDKVARITEVEALGN